MNKLLFVIFFSAVSTMYVCAAILTVRPIDRRPYSRDVTIKMPENQPNLLRFVNGDPEMMKTWDSIRDNLSRMADLFSNRSQNDQWNILYTELKNQVRIDLQSMGADEDILLAFDARLHFGDLQRDLAGFVEGIKDRLTNKAARVYGVWQVGQPVKVERSI